MVVRVVIGSGLHLLAVVYYMIGGFGLIGFLTCKKVFDDLFMLYEQSRKKESIVIIFVLGKFILFDTWSLPCSFFFVFLCVCVVRIASIFRRSLVYKSLPFWFFLFCKADKFRDRFCLPALFVCISSCVQGRCFILFISCISIWLKRWRDGCVATS